MDESVLIEGWDGEIRGQGNTGMLSPKPEYTAVHYNSGTSIPAFEVTSGRVMLSRFYVNSWDDDGIGIGVRAPQEKINTCDNSTAFLTLDRMRVRGLRVGVAVLAGFGDCDDAKILGQLTVNRSDISDYSDYGITTYRVASGFQLNLTYNSFDGNSGGFAHIFAPESNVIANVVGNTMPNDVVFGIATDSLGNAPSAWNIASNKGYFAAAFAGADPMSVYLANNQLAFVGGYFDTQRPTITVTGNRFNDYLSFQIENQSATATIADNANVEKLALVSTNGSTVNQPSAELVDIDNTNLMAN